MDYSKLSNDELLALKNKDYSKLSNETLIALKGESSTSQPEQPSSPGFVDTIKSQMNNGLGPIGMAGQAQDVIQEIMNKAGDYISKNLTKNGIQMSPVAESLPVNPTVAKLAGGVAKAAPTIIGSMMPGEMAANEISPVIKALTPGGRAAVGAEIGAAEKAAGVTEKIPTVASLAKKLDLPARERSFADIVNKVKTTLEEGKPIDTQDLSDFKDLVDQKYGLQQIAKGTKSEAIIAKTKRAAEDLLNQVAPGRGKAAANYAKIKAVQNGLKYIAAGATGAGITGAILRYLAR